MAQKKQPAVDPVRTKAAQMRQAQERADRRTRIIVISAVAVIVLAVVAAVGGVIWKQQAQVNAARNVDASEVLGPYADGRPIIVNANGVVAEADPNLPTLTEYFDYSCHACADL
ncbi:MAG: thioredoxin, partial [Actinomyces sp.]|nr:thioredoxin [Actinomyces sp.]